MSLQQLCQAGNLIDYNNPIGSGTHGTVYASFLSNEIAVKVFPIKTSHVPTCFGVKQTNSCDIIRTGEYAYQETARETINQSKAFFDKDIIGIIDVPDVYGFKFLPNSNQAQCCSYLMKRLYPLETLENHLIQLTFNYDRNYNTVLSSGQYVGIDTLKSMGFSEYEISRINRAIASMTAALHYGMKTDAFDIEFILAAPIDSNDEYGVYAIDFDKFSYYNETFPYCLSRKLTESDYDHRSITDENKLVRLLTTSIIYCPRPDYPEYIEWKNTYIKIATFYGRGDLANKVTSLYEKM